jgi:2-oxoisovalerate dehydrogenase E1 component
MDTTMTSGGTAAPGAARIEPSWQSDLYDGILRDTLGEDALHLDQPVAGSLNGTDLLRAYVMGRVSRDIDVRERALQTQGRAWFSIAGAGKEVIGWAFGRYLTRHDPKMPYYRDRALMLVSGVTPEVMFQSTLGVATDPSSGGRQMPSHWGNRDLGVVAQSSPTGSQCISAAGLAEGIVRCVGGRS